MKNKGRLEKIKNGKKIKQSNIPTIQQKQINMPVKFQALIIFAITFLIYSNTLSHKYALDDLMIITKNSFVNNGLSFENIKEIFSHDSFTGFFAKDKNLLQGGRYRPLSQIMFAVEYNVFNKNPFALHLINVLLYAFCCVLIFYILRKLFKEKADNPWYLSLALFASLLFALHPIHTEVVANIKGRDEILSLLGSMGAVYFCIRFIEKRKIYLLFIACVIFFLALLSKENSITFLAVMPLILIVFYKVKLWDHILCISPLMIAFIAFMIIRNYAINAEDVKVNELLNDPFLNANSDQKLPTIFYTWGVYLKLMIYPHPLTHDYYPYHIELKDWSNIYALGSFLVFLALSVFAVIKIWKKNIFAFGILFFLITFSIVSNLFINIGTFMNERFVFIPLLGFTVIVAYLFNRVMNKYHEKHKKANKLILTIFLIVCVLYSIKTINRNIL